MGNTKRNDHIIIREGKEVLKVPKVERYTNHDGSSAKQLMELTINEIRENRQEINYIKTKLMKGTGKISANRQAITDIFQDVRIEKKKTYIGAGVITVVLNIIKEVGMYIWR